ncbi:MOSC domain-containing protein [Kribbella sp. NPDC051587]|uniref:MOSC domain-containing protein n=1 Tax=Kribbella sp. NPDC051587 TaxID=3364119 RepID=UPI0037AAF6D3
MTQSTLLSVNVGMPQNVEWNGKTVYTGVWKRPVDGPAMVRRLNIDGDGQGDTAGHGGEMRAVLVYQIQSYRYWEQHFGRDDFDYGQFGENLTVDGLPDEEVCIGDRYRIGEAEFEVTQPRVTCYRVGLRMGEPELPALLVGHHRPGFYCRVITEGRIRAGDSIEKTKSGPGALSVADTDALLYLPNRDLEKLKVAVTIPALSPGWQGSFQDLLRGSTAVKPAWTGFRQLLVTDVIAESPSVSSVVLATSDGVDLPTASPGQYLTLKVAGAVRSYSLSSAPGGSSYRISVKHEPHGIASSYLTTQLRAGAVLEVAAPRGDFVLSDDTSPVVLLSAGIGVTPVLAMLHQLAAERSTRPVWWIHGARTADELPLAAEAHALIDALPNAVEQIYFSTTDGRITKDKLAELALPSDATAYICGPAAFMTQMTEALTTLGLDPSRVRTELFSALPATNPGITDRSTRAPHQPEGQPGTGPMVTFARSGISTPFAGNSVLELAEACDVPTRWSCRTGVCQTCVTPLLSGSVSYAPDPLEPAPDGQTLICCAQPTSDLVLDM